MRVNQYSIRGLLLTLVLCLFLTGCGGEKSNAAGTPPADNAAAGNQAAEGITAETDPPAAADEIPLVSDVTPADPGAASNSGATAKPSGGASSGGNSSSGGSTAKPSGGGSGGSSQQPPHVHNWQPVYESIEIPVYERVCYTVCAACGERFGKEVLSEMVSMHMENHAINRESSRRYEQYESVQVGTQTAEDLDHYECACGARKEV